MHVKVRVIGHSKPGSASAVVAKFETDPYFSHTILGCGVQDMPEIGSPKLWRVL